MKNTDLPPRSDPSYMRKYNQKNKERLAAYKRERMAAILKDNPDYWKGRYDPTKAAKYRAKSKPANAEKQWAKRGIVILIPGVGVFPFTWDKYQEDLKAQDGKCKICQCKMDKPQVDHDHVTGAYRGLLCWICNVGLGHYERCREGYRRYLRIHANEGRISIEDFYQATSKMLEERRKMYELNGSKGNIEYKNSIGGMYNAGMNVLMEKYDELVAEGTMAPTSSQKIHDSSANLMSQFMGLLGGHIVEMSATLDEEGLAKHLSNVMRTCLENAVQDLRQRGKLLS